VRPARLALLDDGDGHLPERLGELRVLGEERHEAVRAREPGRPAADDDHADLDALVLRIGRRDDELVGRAEPRRVRRRDDGHY
jgi:hypothetical protein